MVVFAWGDLLVPNPPAFVTAAPSGLLARSIAQQTQQARIADPFRFVSNPDYSAPGTTPIWVDAQAFWDEALGRVPIVSQSIPLPSTAPNQGIVYGAISKWYNKFTQAEEEEKLGILDPNFPAPGSPMATGSIISGATLATVTAGFRQWNFRIRDAAGNEGLVQLSSAYNPELYTARGLQQVLIIPFGSTTPLPAAGFPRTAPEFTPTRAPVTFPIDLPALPGVIPTPVRVPFQIPNPEEFGRRPVPVIPDPSVPAETRRALPGVLISPDGVQVGAGAQDDYAPYSPTETAGGGENGADDITRQQYPGDPCDPCPDPCPEIDYQRIQDSVRKVMGVRWALPGQSYTFNTGSSRSGDSVNITLPSNCVGIRYVLDLSQYERREVWGGGSAPDVYYPGWYAWQSFIDTPGAGDRKFFNYQQGIIECPLYAKRFSATLVNGAVGQFTPILAPSIQPA